MFNLKEVLERCLNEVIVTRSENGYKTYVVDGITGKECIEKMKYNENYSTLYLNWIVTKYLTKDNKIYIEIEK